MTKRPMSLLALTAALGPFVAEAHDIIPTPQSYVAGSGFNTNGKIERMTDAQIAAEGCRLSVTTDRIVIASRFGATGRRCQRSADPQTVFQVRMSNGNKREQKCTQKQAFSFWAS